MLGREPFAERAALMTEASFIADVAVLPAWLRVDQAIDFVAGVHPRFRRDRALALLAKTQITGKRRMRELSKGMKTLVHLALTMAIDARLLVLDEPTLGLDILARRSFYDALVNDYMDATRTILITTHQVEEVENLLTDVLFIDKGRIVLDSSLEDIAARYAAVAVPDDRLHEARAAHPFHERGMLGKTMLYFERPDFDKPAQPRRGADAERFRSFRRQAVLGSAQHADLRVADTPGVLGEQGHLDRACRHRAWSSPSRSCSARSTSSPPSPRSSSVCSARRCCWRTASTFFVVMSIYSSWYLLECLYADRKDRSVLFWKSMPISDIATVISKLATALVAIPLVYFVAADVSTLLMAFIVSLRAHSYFGSALWHPDLWLQLQALWLYVIVTTAIWYLPFTGWLLFVSAWAKRAVMLWLILPPLALYWTESWFFGSHTFGSQLTQRALGYVSRAFYDHSNPSAWATTVVGGDTITTPSSVWHLLNPIGFLSSPATWIGVLVGLALIYGAVQLRLRRTEV